MSGAPAARDTLPPPAPVSGPATARPGSSSFLVEPLFEATPVAPQALPPPRAQLPTRPWDGRVPPAGDAESAPAAAPDEAPERPSLRQPLPSFPIDDEETDQSHEALTTQPISSLPLASPSEVPDIEVEVSLEDAPPASGEGEGEGEGEPESDHGYIGQLSLDAEADLADALEAPPAERPGAELAPAPEPEPESVEVDEGPESLELDEGPEVEAGEADADADAEAYGEGAEAGAYGGPAGLEAVEDELDATQEMAALDLGAEDEAEEADEDELEEVDEAEVQSDPRGRAREPAAAAPYASSVRLTGPERGATPPTPPARAGREEPLDLRTKRRARPWWEELFDDDFLRATPRPTDAQVAAEASFIEARLGLAKGAVILDLACGHGRHAIELTRRGYQVVGFDLSLAMLAHAADEAEAARQKVNFLHGDMRELPFEDKFDGVYCWGTSFGFFEEEKNLALMQRVYRALRPGGVFLVETINRDFIAARQPSLVWYEGDGCLCMDEAQVDFITSRLKVKRTIMLDDGRTREVDYSLRLYGLHELGKMMHEAGFRVIEVSGRLATPGIFFGSDSPQCIVLAERD